MPPALLSEVKDALRVSRDLMIGTDLDGAESAVRIALEKAPDNPVLTRRLSEIAWRRGDHATAISLAGRSLALDQTDPSAYGHLAALHLGSGNLPAAEAAAAAALQRQPGSLEALLRMAEAVLRRGDIDGAHRWSDRLIAEFPNQAGGYLARANAHLARAELGYAEAAPTEAGKRAPGNILIQRRLAYVRALLAERV